MAVAKFPWAASGRALTLDRADGLTKLVLDRETAVLNEGNARRPGPRGGVIVGRQALRPAAFDPRRSNKTFCIALADVLAQHPDPARALSDGPNAWPLQHMQSLLGTLKELDALVKRQPFAEQSL